MAFLAAVIEVVMIDSGLEYMVKKFGGEKLGSVDKVGIAASVATIFVDAPGDAIGLLGTALVVQVHRLCDVFGHALQIFGCLVYDSDSLFLFRIHVILVIGKNQRVGELLDLLSGGGNGKRFNGDDNTLPCFAEGVGDVLAGGAALNGCEVAGGGPSVAEDDRAVHKR